MDDDPVVDGEDIALTREVDIVTIQRRASHWGKVVGMSAFKATRMITAASDLARNTITYGGGGRLRIDLCASGALRMAFVDQGPGITSLEQAMQNGYSTGSGLGLGLPGARRLADEFTIDTAPGKGTTVTIVMRKR